MKRHLKTLGVVAACAAMIWIMVWTTGCDGNRPVTVGVVVPQTGQLSLYGEAILNGIELAHQQLQEDELPRELVLEVRDSKSDPKTAAQQLSELFNGDAMIAIGGVSTAEALEMIPIVDEEEKVLISPSATSPRLTGVSSLFFRVAPSDLREGAKMGNFVAQELDIKKVVIIAAEQPYAKGIQDVFKSEFERYGGEVPAVIEYPQGTTDFGSFVDEALTHEPEAVYVADYAFEIGTIIQLLREKGFRGRILTTHAFAAPSYFEQVGDAAEGVLLTQVVFDPASEDPVVRRFVDAYREKYGERPNAFAAHGYDAMMVIGSVVRGGEIHSSRDFYQELRNLRDFVGAAGPVQFDEKGDVGKFPRVYAIEGGELVDFEIVVEERKREIQERLRELQRRQREAASRAAEGGDGN